jgi:hypothetical protein
MATSKVILFESDNDSRKQMIELFKKAHSVLQRIAKANSIELRVVRNLG